MRQVVTFPLALFDVPVSRPCGCQASEGAAVVNVYSDEGHYLGTGSLVALDGVFAALGIWRVGSYVIECLTCGATWLR